MNVRCQLMAILASCLVLVFPRAMPAADVFSVRGVNGTGVFPARDMVTTFWDIPEGYSFDNKINAPPSAWYTGKGVDPDLILEGAEPGTRKNIVWKTTLPFWGNNMPVATGDKVLLMTEPGWKSVCPELVCLDARSGEILWQEPLDHLDGFPEAEQAEAKAARAAEVDRYKAFMAHWYRCWIDPGTWDLAEHTDDSFRPLYEAAEAAGFPAVHGKFKQRGFRPLSQGSNSFSRGRLGFSDGETSEAIQNHRRCIERAWYRYEGWATEDTWYGYTFGSVVTDGSTVYCVTGIGGVFAYDLAGERKWVRWLPSEQDGERMNHVNPYALGNLSTPVLAGGKLLYFHRDAAAFYALEATSGEIAWRVPVPVDPEDGKGRLLGYTTHMNPGGTPVVLDVDGTLVAIAANGLAVRVGDGTVLGIVTGAGTYPQHYSSWVGRGKVVYATLSGDVDPDDQRKRRMRGIQAIELGLDGDRLTEQVLWRTDRAAGKAGGPGNNTHTHFVVRGDEVWADGNVLSVASGDRLRGVPKGTTGPTPATAEHILDAAIPKGATDFLAFTVHRVGGGKAGLGFLAEPKASGEILDRHVAAMGFPLLHQSALQQGCWGNRLFIRSKDSLWCVGDPAQDWVSPEAVLADMRAAGWHE